MEQSDRQSAPTEKISSGLLSPSFLGLTLTQFLTAVNDNIFRWLVIGIGKDYGDQADANKILVAGTVSFVLPYLVLAAYAGYLADRFSKRSVIIACKVAEIVIMFLGIAAIWLGNVPLLLLVVALTGCQSAIMAPAKLGAIPEILPATSISRANGIFGLMTVSATVIGMGLGSWLSDATRPKGQNHLELSLMILEGIAVFGWMLSLAIRPLRAANPHMPFPLNAAKKTWFDLRTLTSNRPLFRVAVGIAFFWSIGAMAQMNVDQFAAEGGAQTQSAAVPLLIALVLGVGIGSVLAAIWSGPRIELGILPIGATGIAICAMLMFTVDGTIIQSSSTWTGGFIFACVLLLGLGISAGLFDVPLESYLQHRSPPESRGAIFAASNFLTFSGVAFSALIYGAMRFPLFNSSPLLSARHVFLVTGLATIPVLLYILVLIPQASIRFVVWLLTRTLYRVHVTGIENLPERGGALLAPNHISFIDAVMLLVTSSRPIRTLAWAGNFDSRFMKWIGNLWGAILITGGPKSIMRIEDSA
jgi:acyl-[acyl-carrier-protein]-phospholipid O-acyltransferase/long-chain-fatty-acid--[acyl-carrier-protein] ligase